MHFVEANQASADLAPRRKLATEGLSRNTNSLTYAETYFTLTNAAVEGSDIVLQVKPFDDQPPRFFRMVVNSDMTFAFCP